MQLNRPEDAHAAADLAQALTHPLNSLMAMAEMLQRQALSTGATIQVQAIIDMGQRMADVLCDTLDAQSASTPLSPIPTSLRALVDEVEAAWRVKSEVGGAQLLIACNAPADLRVMIDPGGFCRLLDALIKDAVSAHSRGVVEVQLSVSIEPGGRVLIKGRVDAPEGCITAKSPAALDLCSTIVGQMDGALERRQNPGSGVQTAFSVYAPQAGVEVEVADEIDEEGPLPPRTHLLIVDDNATNRIVAAALCEMFGCTSETADDGLQAVAAVQSRHFDLILMDIKMPNMDGLEATRAIRNLPGASANIPIVALTANADPEAVASYIAGGMLGVVDKPIKPAQLLSMLQWALSGTDETRLAQASVA